MRRCGDVERVPLELLEDLITCLPKIDFSSERARQLGLVAPDVFYRAMARIEIFDRFTRQLARTVIAFYFDELGRRGVRCFYLVDNGIPDDRFEAMVELFGLAHFEVVSPHVQGIRWVDLEPRMRTHIAERKSQIDGNYMMSFERRVSREQRLERMRNYFGIRACSWSSANPTSRSVRAMTRVSRG
jgi:hypothetical protein